MTLTAGTITRLQVAREVSPYGFFLTDGEQDVILHYSELTGPVKPGDEVDVFLFYDTEDRLASTLKQPYLTLDQIAPLQVADVHPRYGCFLEMGIGRQLLLPKSELPEYEPLHPQVGDTVYVRMVHDRVGRLVARAALEQDLVPLAFPAPDAWRNTWHEAIVYRPLKMGTFLVLEGGPIGFGVIGFLHESIRPRPLRLGEKVRVRVAHIREDGRVNVTMAERKEIGMDLDAERLFSFLWDRPNGAMPYSDETPADIVKQRFGMSKSAFKRAVGRLMRAGLVKQQGSWTELTEKGSAIGADQLQQILQEEKPEPPRPKKR